MMLFESLSAARKAAREINGTYRKVDGGWLVMSWSDYNVWSKQK